MAQRLKTDWILFSTVLAMVVFGVLLVYSASRDCAWRAYIGSSAMQATSPEARASDSSWACAPLSHPPPGWRAEAKLSAATWRYAGANRMIRKGSTGVIARSSPTLVQSWP